MKSLRLSFLLIMTIFLSSCGEDTILPSPEKMTRDSIGFYCAMIVADHIGPKAQVFEKGQEKSLWFSQVRDAFAYRSMPGEAQNLSVIYVHDMGQATSYDNPQVDGIWIKAKTAFYVINSDKRGGMGARETIPFGQKSDAENFAQQYNGIVVAFNDIPLDYLWGDEGDYETN
ncbi:MAG: nitrous oxide reductase accessory protein NosL [OCS116 cluster bacterium]|uniref:Copper resistance protein CopZ n=1 Tax=OCS116 cluster bacterium TaxID=2030921 RepID=A0A2A4Z2P5_9PROT|nr:nitrous oxide reductase accessory protein NosL [OCS116 cluster bacterium]